MKFASTVSTSALEDLALLDELIKADFKMIKPAHSDSESDLPSPSAVVEDDHSSLSSDSEKESEVNEEQDLFPFCDDPLPPQPLAKLIELKATLLAIPNIMSLPVSLPFSISINLHWVSYVAVLFCEQQFTHTAEYCYLHCCELKQFHLVLPKVGQPPLTLTLWKCMYCPLILFSTSCSP